MNDSVRQPVYEFEGFRLDAQRRVLLGNDGQPIQLTPRLIELLLYLVERPSRLHTKEELLEAIWPHVVVEEHNLNKAISELRRVLGEKRGEHRFIATQPGRGYRFVADVVIAAPPEIEIRKRDDRPLATLETPIETGDRWRFRNLRYLSLIGIAALLAVTVGFIVFNASAPRSEGSLRVTPLSFEKDGGEIPHVIGSTVWKPDSQAIAYAATQTRAAPAPPQPYVLYFDSSSPQPLTQRFPGGLPKVWTPLEHVLLNTSRGPSATSESAGLWTVPAIGGEPEPLFTFPAGTTNILSITADGATVAGLRRDEHGVWGIWAGSIASGVLERYEPAPLAPTAFVNVPALLFSPDGRQLLLMWNPSTEGKPQGEQAWLLPYPPDPADPPRRVLEALPMHRGTPQFSWLPDNRHIVVQTGERSTPARLYLADTESGRFRQLSDGTSTADQRGPVVSPDGTRFVFSEITTNGDIVIMNARTAAVSHLIATNRIEEMPAWAPDAVGLVYVTVRNGESEIWLHEPGKGDRPLVTPRDFPPGTTAAFMAPEISPDGTRVMYLRVESDARGATGARLWMSSLTGVGAPLRLRDRAVQENPGSWSPDGAWYAYLEVQSDASRVLKKARTSGTSEPESLVTGVRLGSVPVWSPDGRWILFDDGGLKLAAADGSMTRELGVTDALCAFSRVPELLYCIENASGARNLVARSLDGTAHVVGPVAREHWPAVTRGPALRLSLTPDGEGVTYSVGSARVQLVLVEGLDEVARP